MMASSSASRAALLTALVALVACAPNLTPRQGAKLREAQEIADRTTDTYSVPRVKVHAASLYDRRTAGVYRDREDWIMLRPEVLDDVDFLSAVTHELGHATLGHKLLGGDICDPGGPPVQGLWKCVPMGSPQGKLWLEKMELDANARAIEIMVRVMGMTQSAALRRFAALLVRNANIPARGGHLGGCRELDDLLSRFPPVTEFPPPQTCWPRR